MITKEDNIAIIGASRNPEKYGHKVSEDLINKGYKVFLINPHDGEILGRTVHKDICNIDADINAAIFVTKPEITEKVLPDVYNCGVRKVWMQPGAESKEAIKYCEKHGIDCIHNSCIMLK